MSRILIVEYEARIAAFPEKGLKANGFATLVAAETANLAGQKRTIWGADWIEPLDEPLASAERRSARTRSRR